MAGAEVTAAVAAVGAEVTAAVADAEAAVAVVVTVETADRLSSLCVMLKRRIPRFEAALLDPIAANSHFGGRYSRNGGVLFFGGDQRLGFACFYDSPLVGEPFEGSPAKTIGSVPRYRASFRLIQLLRPRL